MGVTLYIRGIEKKKEIIRGEIVSQGLYEVDVTNIDDVTITDYVAFDGGIFSVFELSGHQAMSDFGFYGNEEFDFVLRAPSSFDGTSIVNIEGAVHELMFEPKIVLETVQKLLEVIDDLESQEIQEYQEKANLEKLLKIVQETIDKSGILRCYYG
ncbi:hypothetical protein BKI52_34045 [marine bacterium AO1-C]|nr:hypothetical protein BKI52_34045 [marine bacterium AO1-C]